MRLLGVQDDEVVCDVDREDFRFEAFAVGGLELDAIPLRVADQLRDDVEVRHDVHVA